MMSQRYGIHLLADKKKTTLEQWENICDGFKKYGVDIEDDNQFIQGFGDCYITDLIYEQADCILKYASNSLTVQDIVTDDKDMEWIFCREDDEKATLGDVLSIFEKFNLSVQNGSFDKACESE